MQTHGDHWQQQRGVSLPLLAIALAVFAVLVHGLTRYMLNYNERQIGEVLGYSVQQVARAVDNYRASNLSTLTGATPAVAGFANAMAPTLRELKAAGYADNALADQMPDGTQYRIALFKMPAGCVGPISTCNVWSVLWLSSPIVDTNGHPALRRLAAMGAAVDASYSYSGPPDATVIVGGNGAWTIPNPDPARREGIFVVVAGLGGTGTQWLRVGDPRDPDLQGNLTVRGDIASLTGSVGAGTTTVPGCTLGAILNNGQIVSRSSDCVSRAWMLGATGEIVTADPTGAPRAVLDSNGGYTGYASGGLRQLALDPRSSQVLAFDSVGSTATVAISGTSGRVSAQRAQISATATAGTACAGATDQEGDLALDTNTRASVVVCRQGLWRRAGLQPGAVSGACSPNGVLGQDSSDLALICRGGQWASLDDRIGRMLAIERYLVIEGTNVPYPACPAGATSAIVMTPLETLADTSAFPFRTRYAAYADIASDGWIARVRLYDASGAAFTTYGSSTSTPYNLQAIAQTFCEFSS